MLHTQTGIHPTTILVEATTGNPVETPHDTVTFVWAAEAVTAKHYYLNGVLVRTDTYGYTAGKLTSITKEIF